MVTRQPQVERRTAKVRLSETDVLPLCHATNKMCMLSDFAQRKTNPTIKNLAVANRSRVSCAHNSSSASMTLKSTLRVTQGHWKRTNHTRLTIRRVIGRWILSWPWNVGQRSLKIIEISAIRKLGCGFLFAFDSNCGRICSRLLDIQCQRMAWPWKPG